MRTVLRAEWVKIRTTRTTAGLLLLLLGLVALASLLHGFGLSKPDLAQPGTQLKVLADAGEALGAVFAALAGALSITGEYRHGTIRPTLLAVPRRSDVLAAKAISSVAVGAVFGLVASGTAAALEAAALAARSIPLRLAGTNYLHLILGSTAATAFWALVGLGIGAVTRNQVATVVGLFVWVLMVENMLIDAAPTVSRYLPGSLAQSLTGQRIGTLHNLPTAIVALLAYLALALGAGRLATTRADVA